MKHDLATGILSQWQGTFDAAIALEIIEHLERPQTFLDGVSRCLKPQGFALLSTPNLFSPDGAMGKFDEWRTGKRYLAWDPTHKRLFTSGKLIRLLRQHGFHPLRITGYHSDTGSLPWLRLDVRLPFKSSAFWPLNRLGFNIIVEAQRH